MGLAALPHFWPLKNGTAGVTVDKAINGMVRVRREKALVSSGR